DFIEPGGFGAALGNNVSLLAALVPVVRDLLAVCRSHGLLVLHTRVAHCADLSDCPPAKRRRGDPMLRIAGVGAMRRVLVEDATESYFPEFKHATLQMIRAQGAIVGWTAPLEAVATALDGTLAPVRLVSEP